MGDGHHDRPFLNKIYNIKAPPAGARFRKFAELFLSHEPVT
jgi:hypothetical protein